MLPVYPGKFILGSILRSAVLNLVALVLDSLILYSWILGFERGCANVHAAVVTVPENGTTKWANGDIERLTFRLGTPIPFNAPKQLRGLPTAASP
ncbi:hypothetical protein COMA1_10988 [Candidatus Nitrospira nitrosa]|uniref:Uncharacterized protein n=1 Tax=Candidatus Nitrospira nitrosa TaxID=1742972 RepID=A0A0S4L958_9BACT|nr:hypothetical protein COMA1_10988 [Candidatus Nitrospira nitrosa]